MRQEFGLTSDQARKFSRRRFLAGGAATTAAFLVACGGKSAEQSQINTANFDTPAAQSTTQDTKPTAAPIQQETKLGPEWEPINSIRTHLIPITFASLKDEWTEHLRVQYFDHIADVIKGEPADNVPTNIAIWSEKLIDGVTVKAYTEDYKRTIGKKWTARHYTGDVSEVLKIDNEFKALDGIPAMQINRLPIPDPKEMLHSQERLGFEQEILTIVNSKAGNIGFHINFMAAQSRAEIENPRFEAFKTNFKFS